MFSYMIPPQGVDLRGPIVTGGGKGKPRWIVLPYEVSGRANQSQLGY